MPNALVKILAGTPQSPIYGQTIAELTANRIFNWLKEFGASFGWRRAFDLAEIQNAANDGQVVIICAQRVDLHKPGHICPVVPETSTQKAVRSGSAVTKPLQTNAGGHNWQYIARVWWTAVNFGNSVSGFKIDMVETRAKIMNKRVRRGGSTQQMSQNVNETRVSDPGPLNEFRK